MQTKTYIVNTTQYVGGNSFASQFTVSAASFQIDPSNNLIFVGHDGQTIAAFNDWDSVIEKTDD